MKIALDAMGGDHAPLSNVEGALDYIEESGQDAAQIILVGDESKLHEVVGECGRRSEGIIIHHAPDLVLPNDRSATIHRNKPESSLVKSVQLVKDGVANAVVSAGSTGALLSSSLFILGKIPGIKRPALAPLIPLHQHNFILCDAGANSDVKPHHLLQFAIMASSYLEHLVNKKEPSIGLLNIGGEETKGNELTQAAYPLLDRHLSNFIGNIEARYILDGDVDVVVCDGFVGNTVLKFIEGLISHMVDWFEENMKKRSIPSKTIEQINPVIQDTKNILDYEEYGRTPFLGINGIVTKCHGSSSGKSVKNSLISSKKAYDENLIHDISKRITKHLNIFE